MNRIEELEKCLIELPSLTERLHTWNKLIKQLDEMERSDLDVAIDCLKGNNELIDYELHLIEVESFHSNYSSLFSSLLSRLEIPILAYKDKIAELSNLEFKSKVKQFRIDEEKRCTTYAETLAIGYKKDFKNGNQWDYIRTCESMVTGFLFQPRIYPCKNQEERKLFHKAFEGFNPEYYCTIFRKKLKELFQS